MAGRRTNLGLLVALPLSLITGGVAFGLGSGWVRWAVLAHVVAGLAVVILSPWKSVIMRRGLGRAKRGRAVSIAFFVLVLVCIVSGVAHSAGLTEWGPVSAMQVHVGAALASIPLLLWHVVARPVRVHRTDVARRALLRAGTVVGGSGLLYLGVEGVSRLASLPGRHRRVTGSHQRGSFQPDAMPVTQWLFDRVQYIDPSSWSLRVGKRRLSHEELLVFDDDLRATIDCTGGWYATQDWTGIRLDKLLEDVEGASIVVTSATGYARRFPLTDASRLLLATRVGGNLLSEGHGFPARVVAPGRRGFWWVKWVTSIDVDDRSWFLQPPFPLT